MYKIRQIKDVAKVIFLILFCFIFFTLDFKDFQFSTASALEQGELWGNEEIEKNVETEIGLEKEDPRVIIAGVIRIFLGFLGVIALLLIMYGGFLYITSQGEIDKIDRAKKLLLAAFIGLVIILASFAIASFIMNALTNVVGGGSTGPPGPTGPPTSLPPSEGDPCQFNSALDPTCSAGTCSSGLVCDKSDCKCRISTLPAEGESCDSDSQTTICEASDCAGDLICGLGGCTCEKSPIISWITPTNDDKNPNGAVGDIITIGGKFFGTTPGKVYFWDGSDYTIEAKLANDPTIGNADCDAEDVWSPNQITVIITTGAIQGPVKVAHANSNFDTTDNERGPSINDLVINSTKRPGICKIENTNSNRWKCEEFDSANNCIKNDKARGIINDVIKYYGINLKDSIARFGTNENFVTAITSNFVNSDKEGIAQVPNIVTGLTSTFLIRNDTISNYLNFTKDPEALVGPNIISFEPTKGAPGQYVTIRGSGFGNTRSGSKVFFGDTEASYIFPLVCLDSVWNKNQVIVKVPETISNGDYLLKMKVGSWPIVDTININPSLFEVNNTFNIQPSLCKINPTLGPVNTRITLFGEYFGDTAGIVKFHLNNDQDKIDYWGKDTKTTSGIKPDRIDTTVHEDAGTGPVRVVTGNFQSNGMNYKVNTCKNDNECGEKQICCPNTSNKSGSCVLGGIDECFEEVSSSVYEWSFSSRFSSCKTDSDCEDGKICDPDTNLCVYLVCGGYSSANACLAVEKCPNAPGKCQTINNEVLGECGNNFCNTTYAQCNGNCNYNSGLNYCESDLECNYPSSITLENKNYTQTCTKVSWYTEANKGVWQIDPKSQSCPAGSFMDPNNMCNVEPTAGSGEAIVCDLCPDNFSCNNNNKCVIENTVCPVNSLCTNNQCISQSFKCECCCRTDEQYIGQDCCFGLLCEPELCNLDNNNYGQCTGCAVIVSGVPDQERSDDACICEGTTRKYCDLSYPTPQDPIGKCDDQKVCLKTCSRNKECLSGICDDGVCGGNDCLPGIGESCGTLTSTNTCDPGKCKSGLICDANKNCTCQSKSSITCGGYSNSNACLAVDMCPNAPGKCQTIENEVLGECGNDFCKTNFTQCGDNCIYDSTLNYCKLNNAECNPPRLVTLDDKLYTTRCNSVSWNNEPVWQVNVGSRSCPRGSYKAPSGLCNVEITPGSKTPSTCSNCPNNFTCSPNNECLIESNVCPANSLCTNNECISQSFKCECCCRTDEQYKGLDCCYPLECEPDLCNSQNTNYGQCTGCATKVDGVLNQELSNKGCICKGSSNKYCDLTYPTTQDPVGRCVDKKNCFEACSNDWECLTGSCNNNKCGGDECYPGIGEPCGTITESNTCDPGVCKSNLFCDPTKNCTCQPVSQAPTCAGYSSANACVLTQMCPNSVGECQTITSEVVGSCGNTFCNSTYEQCNGNCIYNTESNYCELTTGNTICDKSDPPVCTPESYACNSPEIISLNNNNYTKRCKKVSWTNTGVWQIQIGSESCPAGSFKDPSNGWCNVSAESNPLDYIACDLCPNGSTCRNDDKCAIRENVCPLNSLCEENECVSRIPKCECCCRTDEQYQGEDCCFGLLCEPDLCNSDNSEYGQCIGCRVLVDGVADQERSDQACVCEGTTNKYCDLTYPNETDPVGKCNDKKNCEQTCSRHGECLSGECNNGKCGGILCTGNQCPVQDQCGTACCAGQTCEDASINKCLNCNPGQNKCDDKSCCDTTCVGDAGNTICPGLPGDICKENNNPVCQAGVDSCMLDYTCTTNDDNEDCRCCCREGNVNRWGLECDVTKDCYAGDESDERGIYCGCKQDSDCGDNKVITCNADACCRTRPIVESVIPSEDQTNVCRNPMVSATFNQPMDISSFADNIILIGDYREQVCPSNTKYLTDAQNNIKKSNLKKIFAFLGLGKKAKAVDGNYCIVSGRISVYNDNGKGTVNFIPNQELAPNTQYYVIIKGDNNIDNNINEGVLSYYGASMNSENIGEMFNKNMYYGKIWKFTTGEDICLIDSVIINTYTDINGEEHSSYLFQTSMDDKHVRRDGIPDPPSGCIDDDINNSCYDTINDRDRVFRARAISSNGQIIYQLPEKYAWEWKWSTDDKRIVDISEAATGNANEQTITAQNIKDAKTYVRATTVINKDLIYATQGNEVSASAFVQVFLCENPWPSPEEFPWIDKPECSENLEGAGCENYNFSFYYCRDAGGPGTADDLPVIMSNDAVIRGKTFEQYCEGGFYNRKECGKPGTSVCDYAATNAYCSQGMCAVNVSNSTILGGECATNDDCKSMGSCVNNIFKEFYFLYEQTPGTVGTSTLMAAPMAGVYTTGGAINISWERIKEAVTYKVYYREARQGNVGQYNTFRPREVQQVSDLNIRPNIIIDELKNDVEYCFAITVIDEKYVESTYSEEICATPRDSVAPIAPRNVQAVSGKDTVILTWDANTDDVYKYKIYWSVEEYLGQTGVVKEVDKRTTRYVVPPNDENPLADITYYFGVSAIDSSGNESSKVMASARPL